MLSISIKIPHDGPEITDLALKWNCVSKIIYTF